ncbi:aldo/keto reductase [Polymorphobacter glacialis]|uniref:Aldo/keto reductase n=1 Tax=Sandarakinorhabdus glacialis TaxID=1614636 RepID=A0A916ZMC3_9SPHN|nr:aldo/keto reductase [Polymorphobacter glacialis]GGE04326.1 aldo/keto reductase [Polymorphobacter glacialis]
MQTRKLGTQGLTVSALGLGCMGMAGTAGQAAMYGIVDTDEAVATIHRALENGVNFFDTAEVYGPFLNEELIGRALAGRREQAIIATKFGFRIKDGKVAGTDSTPANVRAVAEASLKRLGTDHIDLFYQHRVDPAVPIEDTVGAMADLVREGKVRYLGLSEAGPGTIARAHAVHPISALQSEWSLWERGVEAEIWPLCQQLGIGFVPYSPLGRGFLTGNQPRAEDLPETDYRKRDPRYQGTNYDANMAAVAIVKSIADIHAATAAQVALAWLLAKGDGVVPIPGSKRRVTLDDNAGAAALALTANDLARLDAALPPGTTAGDRYGSPAMMAMVRL